MPHIYRNNVKQKCPYHLQGITVLDAGSGVTLALVNYILEITCYIT